ncbi:MAG TPA: HEAT repeat domain-containing protein [Candidatus Acidoferrales bacterium]|jgi:HEAT repeat protein|nr:HEAT repeat domain-containing protein [Candidatus Acidoferrales bacterium]
MADNTPRWIWMLTVAAIFATPAGAATEAQCSEILQHALESRNPDTRKLAVVALSLAPGNGRLFETLQQMLQDKDVEVRQAVVASLAEVKTKPATAALLKALDDDVPEVSFAAAKALFNRHEPAGRQALLAVLAKESKTSSGFLTIQKRTALRMMHTPRTTFLFAVQQGVGFVPLPGFGEGVASMQSILTDSGVSGRASAALLLGKDKEADTIEALQDALSDKDSSVRAAAVHSLSLRNDPSLINAIEPMLQDEKEPVRLRAAAGYLRLLAIQAASRGRQRAPK